MKFLLNIKPWILFVIFLIGTILSSGNSYGLFIGIVCSITLVGWIYQIGMTMRTFLPVNSRPDIKYFKFSCILIPSMVILVQIFNSYLMQFISPTDIVGSVIYSIVLVYLMWSWIYINMFAARMLESAIEGRLVYRSDALRAFFYILFCPLGVWYIQRAVQRILTKYNNAQTANLQPTNL